MIPWEYTLRKSWISEGISLGRQEGREEGISLGRNQIAMNLLQETDNVSLISRATGLTEEEIEKMQNQIKDK